MPHNPILARVVYLAGYIEQVGTGTTDIIELCAQQGLKVEYSQDGSFTTIIQRPIDQVTGQVTGQVRNQVRDQVNTPIKRVVAAIDKDTLSREEIMNRLELRGRDNFRVNYMEPAIRLGYVSKLYPESIHRPDQKYYLTPKGLELLVMLNNV